MDAHIHWYSIYKSDCWCRVACQYDSSFRRKSVAASSPQSSKWKLFKSFCAVACHSVGPIGCPYQNMIVLASAARYNFATYPYSVPGSDSHNSGLGPLVWHALHNQMYITSNSNLNVPQNPACHFKLKPHPFQLTVSSCHAQVLSIPLIHFADAVQTLWLYRP